MDLSVKGPDYLSNFSSIASQLINQYILNINSHHYRLAEVEFYYINADHPDVFCHGDTLQSQPGLWYFHRAGGKTYIENSFKGVDISIGDKTGIGGILIRSLASYPEGKIIEGPSKCVDLILRHTGHTSVRNLVEELEQTKLSVFDPKSKLHLSLETLKYQPVYATPRVGLSLKKDVKARLPYIMAPYRFSNSYDQISKNKVLVVLSLYHLYKITDRAQLIALTGVRQGNIEKYLEGAQKQLGITVEKLSSKCSTVEELIGVFVWRYLS